MTTGMTIRPATPADIPAITRIINHYILHTTASYMEEALSEEQMLARYRQIVPAHPFLVAGNEHGELAGFTYAGRFRPQSAWRVLETTIYLEPGLEGRGIGRELYKRLLSLAREDTAISGLVAMISLDNETSIRFHESFGFELTGKWEDCAFKLGRWCGTGSWYLPFPRKGA